MPEIIEQPQSTPSYEDKLKLIQELRELVSSKCLVWIFFLTESANMADPQNFLEACDTLFTA